MGNCKHDYLLFDEGVCSWQAEATGIHVKNNVEREVEVRKANCVGDDGKAKKK